MLDQTQTRQTTQRDKSTFCT